MRDWCEIGFLKPNDENTNQTRNERRDAGITAHNNLKNLDELYI